MHWAKFSKMRAIDWLILVSFTLCLSGSSVYVPYPLRPFHWGLALFLVALTLDSALRAAIWNARLKFPLCILVLLLAIQPLWIVASDRYIQYVTYIIISMLSALLGETIVRQRKPFLFLLPTLLVCWFVIAYFPLFDTWTAAQRFRPRYPLTGGVWNNINDMATALVLINLIWLLYCRRLSLLLFSGCWFYALLLNRRADLAASLVLGVAYLLWFVDGDKLRERLKFLAACTFATIAAILLQNEPLHLVSLPTIQAAPPAIPATPSISSPPSAPAPSTDQAATPVPSAAQAENHLNASANSTTVPVLEAKSTAPAAPAAQVRINAQGGDESAAFRARLAMDMMAEWRTMPWWQWLTGLGAGQLNLTWPGDKSHWASPHLFWLEMFFHIGLSWFVLLGWLVWQLDWRGRLCLAVAGIAGLAPSSMVYFQPFWIFLGVIIASVPKKSNAFPALDAQTHY